MWKLCFFVIACLGLTNGIPDEQRHTTRLESKSFSVTPSSQIEVLSFIRLRESDSAKKCFYQGGQIQVGRSVEVLIPKDSESIFMREMRATDLRPEVKYERIKMKLYGGVGLLQDNRQPNSRPVILSQGPTCTKKSLGSDCTTNDDCCSEWCDQRGGAGRMRLQCV